MLNRALRVLFPLLLLIASPALAVGTIPLSMTQQLDQFGVPLSGCQLFTIQAGTTSTPQNAFKDTALTLPQPNPMICDASGRLPQFFLADGQIKIILRDKLGNPQTVLDNILVIGPSSGAGGGGTIDPTTIASTGDLKHAYGTQVITGWVRFNGRTIGNATSGATERANADTQALFLYLYATDPNLVVSGGRTTGAADYAANKTITLPDSRGRALSGLDDMGNSAAGRLTAAVFGASGGCSGVLGTTLGAACGSQASTMLQSALPNVTLGMTGSLSVLSTRSDVIVGSLISTGSVGSGGTIRAISDGAGAPGNVQITSTGSLASNCSPSCATASVNGGTAQTAMPTIDPRILVTIYIKL